MPRKAAVMPIQPESSQSQFPPLPEVLANAVKRLAEDERAYANVLAKRGQVAKEMEDLTKQIRILQADLSIAQAHKLAAEARQETDVEAINKAESIQAQIEVLTKDRDTLTRDQNGRQAQLEAMKEDIGAKTVTLRQAIRAFKWDCGTNYYESGEALEAAEAFRKLAGRLWAYSRAYPQMTSSSGREYFAKLGVDEGQIRIEARKQEAALHEYILTAGGEIERIAFEL